MKNRLIERGLALAGKRLNGYKTYGGATSKFLVGLSTFLGGLVGILLLIFPEAEVTSVGWEVASGMVMAGLYAMGSALEGAGIGHKIEKESALLEKALQANVAIVPSVPKNSSEPSPPPPLSRDREVMLGAGSAYDGA